MRKPGIVYAILVRKPLGRFYMEDREEDGRII
jgi:hypothetical protein